MTAVLEFIRTMLEDAVIDYEKEMYRDLCRTLGSLTDWVQSTGGNISVKNKELDVLLIKTSGTRLVHCDFQTYSLKMIESIIQKNESLPTGASIETYFHTFPSKFVVHLHPGPALNFLTTAQSSSFGSYKIVEYEKPGYDLYLKLLPYKDEKVILMKNHGIIVMADTIDDIYKELDALQKTIFSNSLKQSDLMFVSTFRRMLQTKYSVDLLVKPTLHGLYGSTCHDRLFVPYTPDHSVFLTIAPFVIEHAPSVWNEATLHKEFQNHLSIFKEFPTIVCVHGLLYTCSNTFDGCIGLEEMLYSYFSITHTSLSDSLSESEVAKLKNWSSEVERRKKLGLVSHSTVLDL
jgi:ribulose-5-phosphate 4-epimerase/fuculose-1-phosphate aldolase